MGAVILVALATLGIAILYWNRNVASGLAKLAEAISPFRRRDSIGTWRVIVCIYPSGLIAIAIIPGLSEILNR